MSESVAQIKQAFAFLEQERGLALVSEEISGSFDNLELEYRSTKYRVRVTRDRSQVLVSFGPAMGVPAYWFGLDLVLEWLGEVRDEDALVESGQRRSGVVAAFTRKHLDRIEPAFAPEQYPETKRELREFAQARAERLLGWRRPGS
jgi:hypothetical protein